MFVSGFGSMGEMSTDDKKRYVENRLEQIDTRIDNLCDCSKGLYQRIFGGEGAVTNNSGRSIESQKSTYDAIMGSAQNLVSWVSSNILFPHDLRYDLLADATDRARRLDAIWNNDLKKRSADLVFHANYVATKSPFTSIGDYFSDPSLHQSEVSREQVAKVIREDSLEINRLQRLATTSQVQDELQADRRDATRAMAKLTLSSQEEARTAAESVPEWGENFCRFVSPVYDCNTKEWRKGVLAIAGGAIVFFILRPYAAPVLKRL